MEKVLEGASQLGFNDFTQKNVEVGWMNGELDAFPIPAGQIAAIIKEIKSVCELIEGMVGE